jgi:ribose-phosphate pyrophosphokinase
MISAFKRASVKSVTAIIPYYGYCRSDRRMAPGTTIAASDVARLYESIGLDRIITLDIHAEQI